MLYLFGCGERRFRARIDPLNGLNDEEVVERYRLNRSGIKNLIERFFRTRLASHTRWSKALTPPLQVKGTMINAEWINIYFWNWYKPELNIVYAIVDIIVNSLTAAYTIALPGKNTQATLCIISLAVGSRDGCISCYLSLGYARLIITWLYAKETWLRYWGYI